MNLSTLHNIVRAVREHLERTSFSWKRKSLSDSDNRIYAEAIAYWVVLLFDIVPAPQQRSAEFYTNWAKRIAQQDVYELADLSGVLLNFFRHVTKPVEDVRVSTVFKRTIADSTEIDYLTMIGLLLSPVKDTYKNYLRAPNANDLCVLTQHLSFLSHVSLNDIEVDTIVDYMDIEVYNKTHSYDDDVLKELNIIIREWFRPFMLKEENFFPQHGNGATAQCPRGTASVRKYDFMGSDTRLTYFCRHFFGLTPKDFVPSSVALGYPETRVCVVQDVPKSLKTRRTISKESTTLMYFQQGVRKALYEYVSKHHYLKNVIFLENASENAQAALRGSRTGTLSTIDLSSASDTVTHSLVRAVFHGTSLDTISVCLRSTTALMPDGSKTVLEKEAPMGSALCFPFECIIFAACMELGVRRASQKWGYDCNDCNFYLGVHGDDMVVPDWAYWDVVWILDSVGFITNKSKSFTYPSRFRESCGMEAYDGVDITPIKLSRRFRGSIRGNLFDGRCDDAPSTYLALVQLANDCATRGFNILRSLVVKDLLSVSPTVPPYFSENPDKGLWSPNPDNYRAARRTPDEAPRSTAGRYQRTEVRCLQVTGKRTFDPSMDCDSFQERRYFETLRASFLRKHPVLEPADAIRIAIEPVNYRMKYTWVGQA